MNFRFWLFAQNAITVNYVGVIPQVYAVDTVPACVDGELENIDDDDDDDSVFDSFGIDDDDDFSDEE